MMILSCRLNCRMFYPWAEYSPFFLRISPCDQQISNQLPVAVLGGDAQGGDAILSRCINPGPGGQQNISQLSVTVLGGDEQGSGAILARGVNQGPGSQQVSSQLPVALLGGDVQQRNLITTEGTQKTLVGNFRVRYQQLSDNITLPQPNRP